MATSARSRYGILVTLTFFCVVAGQGMGIRAGCDDVDGDGLCADVDCNDGNRFCGSDCTDQDGDDICPPFDCDDTVAACDEGSFWSDCADFDHDGVPDCADCADNNPYCRKDCAENPDGDAYCGASDPCPLDPQRVDTDGDGFCTAEDNCPSVSNPSQADHEGELLAQWEFSANASSEWSSTDYSAMQATGEPESAGVCAAGSASTIRACRSRERASPISCAARALRAVPVRSGSARSGSRDRARGTPALNLGGRSRAPHAPRRSASS